MTHAIGTIITNGSSAGKVLSTDAKGTKISNIALERFGGNVGMTQVVPAHLVSSWKALVIGEWGYVLGAPSLRQRYIWSPDYSHLMREIEKVSA